MRLLSIIISALVTIALIFFLDRPLGPLPMPLGKFLSPQYGFWQNAEPATQSFDEELVFPSLKGKATVYFDERLVPHVFAENDEDLYFIQGFLHAKFRLFQMDLQTRAAAGRASEFAGAAAIRYDRGQRRLGMVYAAENALREMEKDPLSKKMFDAYTAGVNSYIGSLTEAKIPLEYKLLHVQPEKWSNLRTALLLKMMAAMLSSGTEADLLNTNAKSVFLPEELKQLYPQVPDSLLPIVPKGTAFEKPGIVPVPPASADSLYLGNRHAVAIQEAEKPDMDNGSNNWVVAGSKTKSNAPILCNDPHLELSLPSIWYEMQLQTPASNAYGVSLPGSPFIIIGFNDSISWGVTNSQRDVKDYYSIRFKDQSKTSYWFNGEWKQADRRVETIRVKGGRDVLDTVSYTIFGPVMYDDTYGDTLHPVTATPLAVRWTAHDPGNDGVTFYHLNRAKNYNEYVNAISSFTCPGQNFIFASRSGDIAIWQQGKFPARWNRQGLYVMPGEDSSYMWQGFIPQTENPHALNPERGYLQSANQRAVDSTYPYFIPGSYITARGTRIDQRLGAMSGITPEDMMALQFDYFNTNADDMRSIFLQYTVEDKLTPAAKKYLDIFRNWNLLATADAKGQTVYMNWMNSLKHAMFDDEFARSKDSVPDINDQTMLELLKRDSANAFIDNISTDTKETLYDIVTAALLSSAVKLGVIERENNGLEWSKANKPGVYHLLDKSKKLFPSFAHAGLPVGGAGDIVNAIKGSHGPSWRMIVQMSSPVEAYGVYPGGQSGNPGSKFYDDYLDKWVQGKYNKLWFMREGDRTDKQVKWIMKFSAG